MTDQSDGAFGSTGAGEALKPCTCIADVDAMLAERNTRIMLPIILRSGDGDTSPKPMIVTEQIKAGRGQKKACGMFATFCPFCGAKYATRAAIALATGAAA